MTPKQRFVTAVAGGIPDQVPCSPLIHHRYAGKVLGRTDWRACFEVHKMLGSVAHRGPIGIGWHVPELPSGYSSRSEEVPMEEGRRGIRFWITTPKGELTSLHVWGFVPGDPEVGKVVEPYVKEPDDWRLYADWVAALAENGSPDTCTACEAYEVMGEEGVASLAFGSLFAHFGAVRDMQPLIYDLYDCPDLLAAVAEPVRYMTRRCVEAFANEVPNEVAWLDICWATGAEISMQDMERWVLPECREVVDLVHSRPGKYIGFYTLGRIRRYMPALVDTGADFIETFEQNMGDLPLWEAKKLYGDRICLMGNFDCVILARGTVEEARQEARRCLQEAMEGGRYVMVTADEVPTDAKWENLRAMVEVCEEEGRYA